MSSRPAITRSAALTLNVTTDRATATDTARRLLNSFMRYLIGFADSTRRVAHVCNTDEKRRPLKAWAPFSPRIVKDLWQANRKEQLFGSERLRLQKRPRGKHPHSADRHTPHNQEILPTTRLFDIESDTTDSEH